MNGSDIGARLRSQGDVEAADYIAKLTAIIAGCQWHWPEDDTSSDSCYDDPLEILDGEAYGTVVAISRGGVVETRYYAVLPAADDSGSDDDFVVNEPTEAAAEAAITAERARRDSTS